VGNLGGSVHGIQASGQERSQGFGCQLWHWITHGSQLEADQATTCVRAALDAGTTTFDTADVYANGRAETILGAALAGEPRDGLEICTKVYFPTGPGPNDRPVTQTHS
jgi:aryl-alcohol dehydrogenase-like predicted oxidoreductase